MLWSSKKQGGHRGKLIEEGGLSSFGIVLYLFLLGGIVLYKWRETMSSPFFIMVEFLPSKIEGDLERRAWRDNLSPNFKNFPFFPSIPLQILSFLAQKLPNKIGPFLSPSCHCLFLSGVSMHTMHYLCKGDNIIDSSTTINANLSVESCNCPKKLRICITHGISLCNFEGTEVTRSFIIALEQDFSNQS